MKIFRNIEPILKPNPKQTFIGIWLHDDNLADDEKHKMELYLSQTFYYYRIFIDMEKFSSYIDEKRRVAKIFFIISNSGLLLYSIVHLLRACPQTEKVYIFYPVETIVPTCFNTNNINHLFNEILKDIRDFITETNQLINVNHEIYIESKPINISRTNNISTSLSKSIPKLVQNTPIRHFTEESITFTSFLIMVQILLHTSYSSSKISDMWRACRKHYEDDDIELTKINNLAQNYDSGKAIRYYTESSCLFRTVNEACRTENVRRMYDFRVYIRDLHNQLEAIGRQQVKAGIKSSIREVYRDKVISESVLQQLIDNELGLISINGFLSTALNPAVTDIYSDIEQPIKQGHIPVRFVLKINEVKQPYANISSCSAIPDEEEILFSLGTIWYIESVTFNETFYQIHLVSYNDLDSHLDTLLKNYTKNGVNLSSLGDVLRELGNYDEAEWFYQKMLQEVNLSEKTRAYLYNNMGMMRKELGDDLIALSYFKSVVDLLQSSMMKSAETESLQDIYKYDVETTIVATLNNMGVLHDKNCNFDAALKCLEQALDVKNGSKLEMAMVHNNLDILYRRDGNDEEARKHHAVAVELVEKSRLCWAEFKKHFDRVDERSQYLANKQTDNNQVTTFHKHKRTFDRDEDH